MAGRTFELFSDFNCPFCYALHERLRDLGLNGRCAWRGVQHAPHLPSPIKSWQGSSLAELRHEVAVVQRIASNLSIAVPRGKPNTQMAIEYAIQCMPEDDRQAPEVVRAIYRTFWCEGKDISDRQVLEQVGKRPMEAASSERARRVAQEWSTAWHATGHHGVPLIIDSDGGLLMGCVSPGQIEEYFYRKGG